MKKYVAIAPEGEYLDITPGKEYRIKNIGRAKTLWYGRHFEIRDDAGDNLFCNEFKCCHLNGKDWTIKEVK